MSLCSHKAPLTTLSCLFVICSLMLTNVGKAQDYSQLFKQLDPTVVTIQTIELVGGERGVQRRSGVGSGVVVREDGLIMTAAHVVHTADAIRVKFVGGETVSAQIISSVRTGDVALLKVAELPASAKVATLGDSDQVSVGEETLIIGAPRGIEHSLSTGHISGKANRQVVAGGSPLDLLQTDAAINPGNSGGPMFNAQGQVIGIVSHILTESGGSDGIGFAVAINAASEMTFNRSPFWTGFEGQLLTPELAEILNVPQKSGLLVQRVVSDSAAGRAGLQGGKIKVNIDGQEIWLGGDVIIEIQQDVCTSRECVRRIASTVEQLRAGEQIQVKVIRAGEVVELNLQL